MERNNPDKHLKIASMMFALIISIVAWVYVVYNYAPMTRVTYAEVPITFIGEDTLTDKGYALSEASNETISVTLNQKRVESTKIDSSDISVVADVSEAVEGKNGISLSISGPEGTQVVDSELKNIAVNVEKAERVEVGIEVCYLDDSEATAEPIVSNLTSTTATVIGAESMISKVDKAVAFIGYSETTAGEAVYTRNLKAVDSSGEELPHMVLYPGKVNFTAEQGLLKTVTLELKTVDNSDDNYERKASAPKTITIKGALENIASLNTIETVEKDITYIYTDSEFDLEYVLPEGVYLANDSQGLKMKVTVTKKAEEEEKDTESTEDNG